MSSRIDGTGSTRLSRKMSRLASGYWSRRGLRCRILAVAGSRVPGTITCENFEFSMPANRIGPCMRSIHAGWLYCCLAETRRGMHGGMEVYVPIADRLFDEHLVSLGSEEQDDG